MVTSSQISLAVLLVMLLLILVFTFIDFIRKRRVKEYPFISFIIPCYNDGDSVGETIESVYNSYDPKKFEIIVANDKSTDNSLEVLKNLQKKYDFRLVSNKINLGKARTLNKVYHLAKSELLVLVDADAIINKRALDDVLARLQRDSRVAAVSTPYDLRNKGFLAEMQEMEGNLHSYLLDAHNAQSTTALWGGCLAVKKSAFKKVGGFSENMLTEDIDLAFKLNEHKWKVEHSSYPILVYSVDNIRSWYKQKIRWTAGGLQCYVKHVKVWIRHPLHVVFLLFYGILGLFFIFGFIKYILFFGSVLDSFKYVQGTLDKTWKSIWMVTGYYAIVIFKRIVGQLSFSLFSLPYVIPMIKNWKQTYKVIYIIPFSLVYWPVYTVVSAMGFVKALVNIKETLSGKKAKWQY